MAGDYWMPLRGHDTSGACPPLSFRPSDPGLGPGSESRNPVTTDRCRFERCPDSMAGDYWMPAYAGMTAELFFAWRPRSRRARRVAVLAGAFAHPTVAGSCRSDIPAVDLVGELLDQVGDALEVRMDRERAAVNVERLLVVAELLQDDAEPRQRAEMARLAHE